jgi:hypothetical protein
MSADHDAAMGAWLTRAGRKQGRDWDGNRDAIGLTLKLTAGWNPLIKQVSSK